MVDRLASQTTDCVGADREGREAAQPDVAILDYSDLVARCMGNLAFVERILGKFEQRLEEDLVLLGNEVNQHDAAGIARVAHRLKGASANVSATGLCDIFDRLERIGRTEQLQQVPACMDELHSEWSRFKAHIPSYLPAGAGDEPTMAV